MPEELLGGGAPPEEGSSKEREALEDEVTEEAQEVMAKRSPEEPTAKEKAVHADEECVTYRSWCPHCVAARGVGHIHQK